MKINPESTINFRKMIKKQAENGMYSMEVQCAGNRIQLHVFPEVFPPQPGFFMGEYLKRISNISKMNVVDVGTGSGIEAIGAALLGVNHVDATDINPQAIRCAQENASINDINNKITFFHSDLFSSISDNKKYDLIFANLPFIDFDGGNELIDLALYDNNHVIHKKFFKQARERLVKNGRIFLPHANLQSGITSQSNLDFIKLEKLINDSGFTAKIISQKTFREKYVWRLYELKLK